MAIVTLNGNPIDVAGSFPQKGQKAPAFQLVAKDHCHSGIAYLAPSVVHHGRADAILDRRHRARMAAYLLHA